VVPLHVEQLLVVRLFLIIFPLEADLFSNSFVNPAVLSHEMALAGFSRAREAIDVSLADGYLFLPVVNLVELVLSRVVQLADPANQHLEMHYALLGGRVHVFQLLNLLVDLFFLGEGVQLAVNALNIQLTPEVGNFLVPEFDHVHDSLVKGFRFALDHVFEGVLGRFVDWENFGKHFAV